MNKTSSFSIFSLKIEWELRYDIQFQNCKAMTGWAAEEAARAGVGRQLGDRLTCNRCWERPGTTDSSLPSLCSSPAQKDILHESLSWFFEMGLVTWTLFLKIQKHRWLKYSRNKCLIRSRATGYPILYPHVGCTNPNIESTNVCLIYTSGQSNQPRGLLAEFSVLPKDPDFLQGTVYEVFWRHCLAIVKELSFTYGHTK